MILQTICINLIQGRGELMLGPKIPSEPSPEH